MTRLQALLTVDGRPIVAEEAVKLLRQHLGVYPSQKRAWYLPIVHEVMIRELAERGGVAPIADDELQAGADKIRASLGLYTAADTEGWLAANGMTLDDFERGVETNLLADKWAETMVGSKVDAYFAEHRADFDRVVLSQIVVADESVARELKEQLEEGEADLAILARAYSIDMSGERDGYLGSVQRMALSREIAASVFAAQENTTVGPFRSDQGYHILQVRELKPAEFDDGLRREIRAILMEPILEAERARVRVLVETA